MKATVSFEYLGADRAGAPLRCLRPKRPWVAELTLKLGRVERRFLNPRTDYADAGRSGKRGIRMWFVLEHGRVYEAERPLSPNHCERVFLLPGPDGVVAEIDREEALRWLKPG